jgi:hypothetical protein
MMDDAIMVEERFFIEARKDGQHGHRDEDEK